MDRTLRALLGPAWAALGLICTGCSFCFVKGPPAEPENAPVTVPSHCTSSLAGPIVDSAIGAFQIARTAVAATADDSVYQNAAISREVDIGAGATLATLFV